MSSSACSRRNPHWRALDKHESFRGVQYTSSACGERLTTHQPRQSVGWPGTCWDNVSPKASSPRSRLSYSPRRLAHAPARQDGHLPLPGKLLQPSQAPLHTRLPEPRGIQGQPPHRYAGSLRKPSSGAGQDQYARNPAGAPSTTIAWQTFQAARSETLIVDTSSGRGLRATLKSRADVSQKWLRHTRQPVEPRRQVDASLSAVSTWAAILASA